ncbi:hypothetical protein B5807_10644 [Epicoccum nigrum]|uniref:Uncharacterized protein n=1 Tax=Epicoccum nigrum TaxID=105696 RepID=A0A1Y2LP47_EPING|nr:hypothetical protein B5807_10644 [Epicoccum nigrum]
MRRGDRALLDGNAVRLDHSLPLIDFHPTCARPLGAKLLLTVRLREASRDCNKYILAWWLASRSCTPSCSFEYDEFGTESIRQCKANSHVNISTRSKAPACAPDAYNVSSSQASLTTPSISNGTMKLLAAILTLSVSLSLGHAANVCGPEPKSCIDLPQSSAKACSSLIAKSKMKLTTCTKAKFTVTRTSTIQPSVTKTVTVTQTVSSTAALTLARTLVTTATSTTTSITTLVQTSTSTLQTTAIVPITSTTTETSTVTSVLLTTVPFPQQTCTTPAMRKRQSPYKMLDIVPRDCSCYLMTTTTCGGTTATTWTTITKPTLTISVTKSKVNTIIKPETRTTDTLQTTTAVTDEISTETSFSTISTTETISATSVVATATTGKAPITKSRAILTASSYNRNRNRHPDSHERSLRQPISLYSHATRLPWRGVGRDVRLHQS